MSSATDTYVLLRAFVDELARSGMRAACTSPGSRSAPLALTLAHEPRLRCFSHVDERCAGFFALGLAKASGLPVAVACTSGTAVAELLPAAIEAHEARVPLLLLTADRPPELRENGAGQAIDQLKLFGSAAKWFFEVGTHQASPERLRWIRTLACRAYATTLEGRPGVVHLNFPLREPLVTDEPLGDDASGRADGGPFVRRRREDHYSAEEDIETTRHLIGSARRGVVVAGRDERGGLDWSPGVGAAKFAAVLGWPLLADPMSNARRGPAAIAHYDALLRQQAFARSLTPDLVLRIGDLPVSKPLRTWLGSLTSVAQVAFDPDAAWQDPASVLSHSLEIDHGSVLETLSEGSLPRAEEGWLAQWRSADELAAEAIRTVLSERGLSEPLVAAELGVLLPEDATLLVASSMPVRDIETFWPAREDPPRVLCNRGANGIDGIVSSAFGVAAADGGPVVLLIGDVALAHDIGGLLAAKRLELKLTIVLLDNGGGGIFDFLPVAENEFAREHDIYTRHIATPTGLDFADAAKLYGLGHERAEDIPGFRAALERGLDSERSCIVEARGEREQNRLLHTRISQAVGASLDER
jgi:2-succinyl-5-enolpyruvyl-6-hydroxy-3-cyclohexene-1-carboxylate synthase